MSNFQKTNFANMFSTKIRFSFTILLLFFSMGIVKTKAQEIAIIDTSAYLPLIFDGALENNLMVASMYGYESEIERLIRKGADIDRDTYEGATPLIFAVANNRMNAVLKLLQYNPKVDKMTSTYETPLIIAVRNQNSEIAEVLIRNGADIELADNYSVSPLHHAVLSGNIEMTDMLIYYMADLNKKAYDGTTPLMTAILLGYHDIAFLLMQKGANLVARDRDGFTPLLIAAQNGDTLIMNALLKEGVDLYEKNRFNYNALGLAIESNQIPAVEFLLRKGKLWNSEAKGGVNPHTVAASYGRKEISALLEKSNVPGHQGLRIDEITVSPYIKFNTKDYFAGAFITMKEPLINAGFRLGFEIKPQYTRVLVENNERNFYQYYDKSSIVYGGVFKDFRLAEPRSDMTIHATTYLSAGYKFGPEFRGTNISPGNGLKIIPGIGLLLRKNKINTGVDIEYMNPGFAGQPPFWIRFNLGYTYFVSKARMPLKTIKWN
jgi:ankyrin repeat protein